MASPDDDFCDEAQPAAEEAGVRSARGGGALRGEDYDRLMTLTMEGSPAARAETVQMIGDVYALHGARMTAEEIVVTAEILHELVREIETPLRRLLSEKLAASPQAPRELVVFLANDSIEAAYPVLCRSNVLEQRDLIAVARLRGMQHRLAIAAREDVGEDLSDALVSPEAPRDEPDVLLRLLENPKARISARAMTFLVEEAKRRAPLRAPVLSRHELKADQARRLYWLVSAALRRKILESFRIDPLELDEQLQETVASLVERDRDAEGEPALWAAAIAAALKAAEALNAAILLQTLRSGHVVVFEAMFAEMLALPLPTAQRIIYDEGGEALAVACRAVDVEKPAFASIFLLTRRARASAAHAVDPIEMSRALAVFDDLSEDQALRLVRRWRLDGGFLSAQRALEAGERRIVH